MILNLTDITEEEIKERAKMFGEELKSGTLPVVIDQSDYYSDKLYEVYQNMNDLREKENHSIIVQNNRERANEIGNSCFDTALKGSKTFQKSRRK